jgi:CRP/FNR family transcriptional regulator, cyclic AMP receptor protein
MADILDYCEGQPIVKFGSGETMIAEGSARGLLYILIEGQIEVIRRDTQVTHIDEPGSVFGEMSVLLDMPHSATVKALSDVQAYKIDEAMSFLESNADVAIHIATLLARRLYYTTTYLVDLQQQAEGKRRDLDMVDEILGSLVEARPEGAAAAAEVPAGRRGSRKKAES